MTLNEIARLYKIRKNGVVKSSTFNKYCVLLDKGILPWLGDCDPLTEWRVREWLDLITREHKQLSPVACLEMLRRVVNFMPSEAGDVYWLKAVRIKRPSGAKLVKTLQPHEYRRLMERLVTVPDDVNIGVMMGLAAGMRLGEVLALRWDNVELRGRYRVLRVEESYVDHYDPALRRRVAVLGTPKTETSGREIPVSAELYKALKKVGRNRVARLGAGEDRTCRGRDGRFVVGGLRHPMSRTRFINRFKRLLVELGIGNYTFHELRHTFATMAAQSEPNIKLVSRILGHRKIETTCNLYVHPTREQAQKCINKISKRLMTKKK